MLTKEFYCLSNKTLISSVKPFKVPFLRATENNISRYGILLNDKLSVKSSFENEKWPVTGTRNVLYGNQAPPAEGLFKTQWKDDNICYSQYVTTIYRM